MSLIEKNPKIAAALNLIFWGLGFIYVGRRVVLGVALIFAELLFCLSYFTAFPEILSGTGLKLSSSLFMVFWVFLTVLLIYDSYRDAEEFNKLNI